MQFHFTTMLFSYIIIFATLYSCTCARVRADVRAGRRSALRVIAGRDARPDEFPYVVRVEELIEITEGGVNSFHRKHKCTGIALSAGASITAEHCCFPLRQTKIIIGKSGNVTTVTTMVLRTGIRDTRPADDDRITTVLSCQLPPSARQNTHPLMINDVAILRTQPLVLRSYARLSALDPRTLYGQRVTMLGYGTTNTSHGTLNDTLSLGMPLQVVEAMWTPCIDDVYPLVCCVNPCGQHVTVCFGDSGGPVLHASGVAGIITRGPKYRNCNPITDAFWDPIIVQITPLAIYMDWIADCL